MLFVVAAVVMAGVVVMVMTMGMINNIACRFIAFEYWLSNGGCNGSSSENECNGKLHLNHFLSNEM